jgi:hypothetical protein
MTTEEKLEAILKLTGESLDDGEKELLKPIIEEKHDFGVCDFLDVSRLKYRKQIREILRKEDTKG